MKVVIALSFAGIFLATFLLLSAVASCLDETAAFAERVCGEISNKGSSQLVSGSGQLSAEAKGLITRIPRISSRRRQNLMQRFLLMKMLFGKSWPRSTRMPENVS